MKNLVTRAEEYFAEGKISKKTLSITDKPVKFLVPKSDLWDIKKAKRLVITID